MMGGNNNTKFALLIHIYGLPHMFFVVEGQFQQNSGIWLGGGNHSTGQTLKTGLDEQ